MTNTVKAVQDDTLDPTTGLAVALLEHGRMLQQHANVVSRRVDFTESHAALLSHRETVASRIKACPKARSFIPINNDGSLHDPVAVSLLAYCVYMMTATENGPPRLAWACEVVAAGDMRMYLRARTTAFRMAKNGILTYRDGTPIYNGTLSPALKVLDFLFRYTKPIFYGEAAVAKAAARRPGQPSGKAVPASAAPAHNGSPAITAPQVLYDEIRRYVIGLDPLVRTFVARLQLHLKRMEHLKGRNPTEISNSISNEALLFVGPSGSGKTWTAEVAGRLCGLPFGSTDLSGVTEDGWCGGSVSDVCRTVITAAGNDVERARYGIIFADEVDSRRRSPGMDRDISGASVQKALLRLMEGGDYMVGGRRGSWDTPVPFSTAGTMWIFAGSFVGIEDILARQSKRHSPMGFAVPLDGGRGSGDIRAALETWLLPEFLNRLSGILVFPPATVEQLMRQATAPTGIISSYSQLLKPDGVTLQVSRAGVRLMAEWAHANKTASRGLKSAVGTLVQEVVFNGVRNRKVVFGAVEVRRALASMGDGG